MKQIIIRKVVIRDVDRCSEIEKISYGAEAASREKILKRIVSYPEGFVVLELDGEVVGFINSGATHNVDLSDDEFKDLTGHDPNGKHIIILSVVVHPDFQGQGFARRLMEHFILEMKKMDKDDIALICLDELIDMYKKYGFQYICVSASVHGGLNWHEMVLPLSTV